MNRAELIALASPPCRECGQPVQRVENTWRVVDGAPQLVAVMVCAAEHRVLVEPIENEERTND